MGSRGLALIVGAVAFLPVFVGATPALAAAGELDASFGSGGKVITAVGAGDDQAYAVASEGSDVLAAGTSQGDFALVRYQVNGSLDASFGSGGKVTTDFGGADTAYGLAVQPDGKVIVAGSTTTETSP